MSKELNDFFQIEANQNRIQATLKGFWKPKFLEENHTILFDRFKKTVDLMNKTKFFVIADLRDFKHPSPDAKELIGKMMNYASSMGLYRSIEIVDRSLLKVAIEATAKDNMGDDQRIVVASMEEALEKAKDIERELNTV